MSRVCYIYTVGDAYCAYSIYTSEPMCIQMPVRKRCAHSYMAAHIHLGAVWETGGFAIFGALRYADDIRGASRWHLVQRAGPSFGYTHIYIMRFGWVIAAAETTGHFFLLGGHGILRKRLPRLVVRFSCHLDILLRSFLYFTRELELYIYIMWVWK